MRHRALRGHNRLHKRIERWRAETLSVDVTDFLLHVRERSYIKINVHPWNALVLTGSAVPEPRRKTKQLILEGLLDIYDDWKRKLDGIGQSYYLKIWLTEPRFSHSQVVCAVGDCLGYYDNAFYKMNDRTTPNVANYGRAKARLQNLRWEHCLDEDHYDANDVGNPDDYATLKDYQEAKQWFADLLQKPHRTTLLNQPVGSAKESYSFKRGDIWIGGA